MIPSGFRVRWIVLIPLLLMHIGAVSAFWFFTWDAFVAFLVLYFFTADWCAPCWTLKDNVFSRAQVARLLAEGYVPVEVVDRMREEGANSRDVDRVQLRFLIDAFPTLVVARPDKGHGIFEYGLLNEEGMVRYLKRAPEELRELEGR